MTHQSRMTEKEKIYFFCLLFPPLWIFIPVIMVCDFGDWLKRKIKR